MHYVRVGYTTDRELELGSSPCPEGFYSTVIIKYKLTDQACQLDCELCRKRK